MAPTNRAVRQSYMAETPCKWFASETGCFRGENCFFLHDRASPPPQASTSTSTATEEDLQCSICLEAPQSFGLLDCSHVYCFQCIMKWRASGKEREAHSASAQCPSCRLVTKLVVPSKVFEPAGPAKDAIIQAYKDSKKAIPCRNFDKAVAAGRLSCPFGTDCLYSHKDPETGEDYIFDFSHDDTLERARTHADRRRYREANEVERLHRYIQRAYMHMDYDLDGLDYDGTDFEPSDDEWEDEDDEDEAGWGEGPRAYRYSAAVEHELVGLYQAMLESEARRLRDRDGEEGPSDPADAHSEEEAGESSERESMPDLEDID